MGFCEIFTLILVVGKLAGAMDWSWWLVLLPEIIAILFYIGLFIGRISLVKK